MSQYLLQAKSTKTSGRSGCARDGALLVLEQCIATSEPAYLAKHAFQLAQEFNNFYHKHHILTEEDPARKTFLLATAAVVLRELVDGAWLAGHRKPRGDVSASFPMWHASHWSLWRHGYSAPRLVL